METKTFFRSDLMEEVSVRQGQGQLPGISTKVKREGETEIFETYVLDEEGSSLCGKPIGRYITFSFKEPWLMGEEEQERLSESIATELCSLIDEAGGRDGAVLLAGLGNRRMTADAIGPAVQSKILVTGHLKKLDPALFAHLGQREVTALAPGVLGDTGMESAEVIGAVVKEMKPGVILVVDALAAGTTARLCRTVQLSDTGISPGSGVGNDRPGFSRERFGIPVIAIGVPTVVDSSTLVADAFEKVSGEELNEEMAAVLNGGERFFVSLKEVDAAVESLSQIIAEAIDRALAVDS